MSVVTVGPGADGGRHRLKVLLAVLEQVTLVTGLGERGPASGLVAGRHLGLQDGLVAHAGGVEGDEPRARPVDEHDERRWRVVEDAGQRPHVGPGIDDERVVERHP